MHTNTHKNMISKFEIIKILFILVNFLISIALEVIIIIYNFTLFNRNKVFTYLIFFGTDLNAIKTKKVLKFGFFSLGFVN